MNCKSKQIKYFILCVIFTTQISTIISAQVLNWCSYGYAPGGGFYQNIDNSTIDVQISGLVSDYCNDNNGNNFVKTGINDGGLDGIQHFYSFLFSETVDVSFLINDVNYGGNWNDQLIFSEHPIVYSINGGMTVSGDTIFPSQTEYSDEALIGVRFENINSLIIIHGSGIGPNPGYINIENLVFGDKIATLNMSTETLPKICQTESGLRITGISSEPSNFSIVNLEGRTIKSSHLYVNEELLVTFDRIPAGIYYLQFELKNGELVRKKIVIH